MVDPAFELAALRACRARRLSGPERAEVEAVAAQTGRQLVDIQQPAGPAICLGWADGCAPNPQDGVLQVRRLTSSPLITLATCLGLCWQNRDEPPYPGRSVAVDDVLAAVAALGADHAHTLGALRNDLSLSGLIEFDGRQVKLGPALAVLAPAQVDALRRFSELLPRGADV